MRPNHLAVVLTASFAVCGCATITSNEMQTVTVTTKAADGSAENVDCSLQNDKGNWQVQAPGSVAVHRSADDLMVECKKEGLPDGFLRAISRAAGGMFGNIVFGGGIGAIIDHTKGTGYSYPNDLPVKMGESTTVDKRLEKQAEPVSPQAEAGTEATGEAKVN